MKTYNKNNIICLKINHVYSIKYMKNIQIKNSRYSKQVSRVCDKLILIKVL